MCCGPPAAPSQAQGAQMSQRTKCAPALPSLDRLATVWHMCSMCCWRTPPSPSLHNPCPTPARERPMFPLLKPTSAPSQAAAAAAPALQAQCLAGTRRPAMPAGPSCSGQQTMGIASPQLTMTRCSARRVRSRAASASNQGPSPAPPPPPAPLQVLISQAPYHPLHLLQMTAFRPTIPGLSSVNLLRDLPLSVWSMVATPWATSSTPSMTVTQRPTSCALAPPTTANPVFGRYANQEHAPSMDKSQCLHTLQ